jgi:hypothetical protein
MNLLLHQSEQRGLGFLFDRKHFAKFALGCFQLGLFFLVRSLVLGERGFDLSGGRIVINRLLQRFLLRTWSPAKTATATSPAVATATIATTLAATTESPAAPETDITTRVHHLLDQGLNGAPVGVVGEVQFFTHAIHHALLELGGITTTLAAAAAISAAIILLRLKAGDAHA